MKGAKGELFRKSSKVDEIAVLCKLNSACCLCESTGANTLTNISFIRLSDVDNFQILVPEQAPEERPTTNTEIPATGSSTTESSTTTEGNNTTQR